MNRNKFITKWLGNKNYPYTAENRGLMLDDLDLLMEQALNKHFVRRSAKTRPKPLQGDYYESMTEGDMPSTRVDGLTWKEEYERDLAYWERHYA